jgi:Zn-dependent protease
VGDPLSWSFPLGRLFGITIKVHILYPVVAAGLILRTAFKTDPPPIPGSWMDMTALVCLLFLAVLLHEFGHCFAGRWVDGDAEEILIWPLGGLAYVKVPHTARANLITAAAGPLVNLGLCLLCALLLIGVYGCRPPLHPLNYPWRVDAAGTVNLWAWGGQGEVAFRPEGGLANVGAILLARFFWVNWFLTLFNLVLIGFPMDMGRIFQAILWRYVGYRQATLAAILAGFVTMFVVALFSFMMNEVLALCLALFIYVSCRLEWFALENAGDEGQFGYDFSQGYTSLEREQVAAPPPRRRLSWWQRWQQRRAARRLQRDMELREAEERRMDELLEKVQQQGISALTDEERRFLKRVSDRFRNR